MDDRVNPRVAEAIGTVATQADCDLEEAYRLLRLRADALAQTVEHTALDVLDGIVRFDT
jgi:hypothetical protein